MNHDEYLIDAKRLIRMSSALTATGMTENQTIQGTLLFAIGVEKLLKHILGCVNPIFILEKPDFAHSVQALYKGKVIPSTKHNELAEKPDTSVIALRPAISRSLVFSRAVLNSKNLLYRLATWRDIIVHRPCSELDVEAASLMLRKDAAKLVKELCVQHNYVVFEFLGESESRLLRLSEELTDQSKFDEEMKSLLARHKAVWTDCATRPDCVAEAKGLTELVLNGGGDTFSFDLVKCPACGNDSLVRVEPNYEYSDRESYVNGVYADYLQCYFCDLKLGTYEELKYVDVDALLAQNYTSD